MYTSAYQYLKCDNWGKIRLTILEQVYLWENRRTQCWLLERIVASSFDVNFRNVVVIILNVVNEYLRSNIFTTSLPRNKFSFEYIRILYSHIWYNLIGSIIEK